MTLRYVFITLIVMTFWPRTVFSAGQQQPVLLPCRPIDAGTKEGESKDRWLIALVDRQTRFRLEPLKGVATVKEKDVVAAMPNRYKYDDFLDEESFRVVAPKVRANYLLVQKFEIMNHEKSISYYAEIVSVNGRKIIAQTEKDIPFDLTSTGIDSCLETLLTQFGVKFSTEAQRFLHLPITGTSFRSLKSLGELILSEYDASTDKMKCAQEYEKLIKKDPFMLLANDAAGKLYFSLGEYDKSARYIKELLDVTPVHTDLYLTLAQSYRLGGRYNEALKIAILCERARLKTVPYLLEKALALEGLKQEGPAFSVHQQVLMLDANQPISLLFMANLRNNELKYKDAKQYAVRLVQFDPDNAKGYLELGRSLIGLKSYQKAEKALKRAEELQPEEPTVQEHLGDLCMINKKYGEANRHYQRASVLRPLELDLYLKTANSLEADGKNEDALKLLYSIAGRFPSKPLLRRQMGLLEYATGNLDSASRSLTMYLAIESKDGHVLMTLGNIYMQKKNYRKAEDNFEKALPLIKDKIPCRLALAEAKLNQKEHGEANSLLRGIIAEKPVKKAHWMMGDAYLQEDNKKAALKEYKKERDLHGDDPVLQEHIAQLHYDLKSYIGARQEFTKLLKLVPNHAGAHYHLALCALRRKNVNRASYHLNKAENIAKASPSIYYETGTLLRGLKVYDKAVMAFQRCISLSPDHQKALCDLADTYITIKNDTAAAAINVKLFGLNSNAYSARLATAGHLYRKHNQTKAAIAAYRRFLDKGYHDFTVNVGYAAISYDNHDYPKVIDLLKNMEGDFIKDKQNLLMYSHALCETGKHKAALPWLLKLRQLTTEIPLEARLSAQASEITGDTITAIAMYDRLLSFPPDSLHTEESYHLGRLYEAKNLSENAINRYEMNIKESPDDLRSHERLSTLYMERSDWKNARRVLELAQKFPNVTTAIQKMLAQTYQAMGNMDEAAKLYTVYLSRVKNDCASWKELSNIYYSRKMFEEAVSPLKKVTELEPSWFMGWYMLGASLVATEKFTEAITPLGHARALDAKNIPAIELLARCYRYRHETSTLTSILREWIALDPKRYDIKMEIGSILLDEKKIDEAIRMLTEAVRFIPTEAVPHLLLARAYELKADDSLRFVHLTSALKFGETMWQTHYQMSRYYISKGLGLDAEPHLKKAIGINPNFAKAHYDYGSLLADRGDYSRANEEFSIAAETEPDNRLYAVLQAYTEFKTGNTRSAIKKVHKLVAEEKADAQVLYWAGVTYKESGRIREAIETLNSAVSADNGCAACMEKLGDIEMEQVHFKQAARHYFKAWEKGGYNPIRVGKLGNALLYDSKYVEAKDFYETILSKNSKYDDVKYRLVVAYCNLGELKKARKLIPTFQTKGTPWMQLAQGTLFRFEQNYDAALLAYGIAGKIAPEHPDVAAGLGKCYMHKEQYDSAIMYLSLASAADTLNMHAMMDLGDIFHHMGNEASAIQYYLEVDKKYPYYPEVQLKIAAIKSQHKAHEIAIRYLERGLQYHGDDTSLYFMLGKEYVRSDKYKPALKAFKKALKEGKGHPIEAFRWIGNIYFEKLVNTRKAKSYYKKYVKAGGKESEVAERLAGI